MLSDAALPPRPAVLIVAVIFALGSTTLASAAEGLLPRSALPGVQSIDRIDRREMPRFNVEALRAEDAERERSIVPLPARYAKNLPVAFTPDTSGTWETLADGSRLWRLRISSPGALSLSLGLERFDLPAGAAFWIHAPDGSGVQGPYATENRNALGGLWTAVVLGDELVAELQVPKDTEVDLRIASVNHGYRIFGEREQSAILKQRSCNIDVICPEGNGWRDQIRSVARFSVSDGAFLYLCTAQLVNNTSGDDTPYLLTAGHCILDEDEASTLVAYWNYESPTCGALSGGTLTQNQSGSSFMAQWWEVEDDFYLGGSDFTLLELDQEPDPTFNVYYAGWDARDQVPDATVAIHQPHADEKAISFDHDPPTITPLLDDEPAEDGLFLRVGDWDEGSTEGGSSGGCLFDAETGLCVGTLHGGYAACGNNLPDWYGRVFAHWTGGGTPETRLSDWLDPAGSGELFLDGKNASATATNETWLIPATASRPGVGTSDWKSQISLANPGTESRSVSLYYAPEGEVWPGTLLAGPFTVEPNQSLYLDDALFRQNPTAGLIYLTVDGTGTVAFSRTINLTEGDVTFGQGVPGIRLTDVSRARELVIPLVHSIPGRYRTNLGFAQASAGNFRVWVEIYSADGELLAEKIWAVNSTAWRQINNIFEKMGIGDEEVEGGWIRVTLAGGSPAYWTTYATVIDDATNDPTYVLPVAP